MDNKYHNRLANDICDSAAYAALFDELQSVQTCSQSRSQSYVKSCSEATTPPDSGWVWWDTDSVVPNEPLQAPTFSSVDGMSKALRRKTQNRNAYDCQRCVILRHTDSSQTTSTSGAAAIARKRPSQQDSDAGEAVQSAIPCEQEAESGTVLGE